MTERDGENNKTKLLRTKTEHNFSSYASTSMQQNVTEMLTVHKFTRISALFGIRYPDEAKRKRANDESTIKMRGKGFEVSMHCIHLHMCASGWRYFFFSDNFL